MVCREVKEVVWEELTKLEQKQTEGLSVFFSFISYFDKKMQSVPSRLMSSSGITPVLWDD